MVVAGAAILPFPKNDNEDDAVANGFVSMRRELLLYRDESAEKPKTQPGRIVITITIIPSEDCRSRWPLSTFICIIHRGRSDLRVVFSSYSPV